MIKAYYYGLISFQDAQIGRVMKALQATGEAGNTIIVYTSDHGDLMGDFGMYFKSNFLEGSIRVPIILAGPGVPAEQVREQLVGLQDILPTLAELTNCPLTHDIDGLNLTGTFDDPNADLRDIYYAQCLDDPKQSAMIFDGRFKYIYSQAGPNEELYDLQADPNELTNLASGSDADKLLPSWRERLAAEAKRLGDTGMLDGDGLAASELDRKSIAKLPVQDMGWRWY